MSPIPAPLFRDPVADGATDPTLVFHRGERSWWMLYTARRANSPILPGVGWVHGTDIGIASSSDGGATWTYRGTAAGLDIEWGRHTYWAPEVIDDGRTYHMFVSVIRGVPDRWEGHEREIRHYTSDDLTHWLYRSTIELSSRYVIDACVAPLTEGGWRMWFKDEGHGSATWTADSADLFTWRTGGAAVTDPPHEGPNVFELGGAYWMVTDEWHGLGVYRSDDLDRWERQGVLLDVPGERPDDAALGHHADVVERGDGTAAIIYFTHPDGGRRSSIQAAVLRTDGATLRCDRDEPVEGPLLPLDGPVPATP